MKYSLATLTQKIGQLLSLQQYRLTVAESCTGGSLAAAITAIPGCSAWFDRGFITYSNAAKQELLGVPAATLREQGAVSQATASAMAEGALRFSHAQLSIATTGIAGPDGGTVSQPVGTVWFAWASNYFPTLTEEVCFTGNREQIRQAAVKHALIKLLDFIS